MCLFSCLFICWFIHSNRYCKSPSASSLVGDPGKSAVSGYFNVFLGVRVCGLEGKAWVQAVKWWRNKGCQCDEKLWDELCLSLTVVTLMYLEMPTSRNFISCKWAYPTLIQLPWASSMDRLSPLPRFTPNSHKKIVGKRRQNQRNKNPSVIVCCRFAESNLGTLFCSKIKLLVFFRYSGASLKRIAFICEK